MKIINYFFIIILVINLLSCKFSIDKKYKLENDFKNHISNYDLKLYDGDYLHPSYAYFKKGKIIGLEFITNPECGKFIKRYFINNNEEVEKIIYEQNNYNEEYCVVQNDSIYVIDVKTKKIDIYTEISTIYKTNNEKLYNELNIDLNEYIKKVKKWETK
jgi:hypothetical protein